MIPNGPKIVPRMVIERMVKAGGRWAVLRCTMAAITAIQRVVSANRAVSEGLSPLGLSTPLRRLAAGLRDSAPHWLGGVGMPHGRFRGPICFAFRWRFGITRNLGWQLPFI